jgi:hypothetical protein
MKSKVVIFLKIIHIKFHRFFSIYFLLYATTNTTKTITNKTDFLLFLLMAERKKNCIN